MRTSSPSFGAFPAVWLTALVLGLTLAGAAGAQSVDVEVPDPRVSELPTSDALDDLDRQLNEADEPNTELWEEYKRFRTEDDEYRHSTERVEIGGSIVIQEDEYIDGDVVAVGGRVTVHGHVEGDVVAVGGDVQLGEGAVVEGDAVSVGGKVREIGDAEVLGERVSIDIGLNFGNWFGRGDHEFGGLDIGRPGWLIFSMETAFLIAGLLVALLLYALAGRRLDVVSRRIDDEPGQSFLIGLLGAFATPFALVITSVLLIVTIIGTLLIPVLAIVVVAMALAGFVAVALTVGRRITSARGSGDELQPARSPYFHIFIGFIALYALDFIGKLLELGPGPIFGPFSMLFGVLGGFVVIFASILGYGALMISRFGTEPSVASAGAGVMLPPAAMPPPPPPSAGPPPAPGSAPPPQPPAATDAPPGDAPGADEGTKPSA